MPAVGKRHIRWREPITIRFGFSGITSEESVVLARGRLREQFPDLDKPDQCVYVVRLKGGVAIDYEKDFSPVIYIGEGNAAYRLHTHASWIAELLVAVPNAEIEVRVADCVRANDTKLCRYVEADMIARFLKKYGCLPWFNRQRESKHEGRRTYTRDVVKEFNQRIGKVQGSNYIWAIRPTHNNKQHAPYCAGWKPRAKNSSKLTLLRGAA
ncbi:MAG TPA: hypothetical protein VFH52_00240 [Rhodanobacteraceae bacterium]|nr:hypothetical protein [Rhodanobacteraceae bacterium]